MSDTTYEIAVKYVKRGMFSERCAKVGWAAAREYSVQCDGKELPKWEDASEWDRKEAIHAAEFWMKNYQNKDVPDSALHDYWVNHQIHNGWEYSVIDDPENKKSSRLKPFIMLDEQVVMMTRIFRVVVETCNFYAGHHRNFQ